MTRPRLTQPRMRSFGPGTPSPRPDLATNAWTELAAQITLATQRRRYTGGPLRSAVFAVVREMRSQSISWESVYNALTAFAGAPSLELVRALDCYAYSSRRASLVAHMHSWEDCECLEEIEGGERYAER